jgi:N-glycosylase/DNA lyase
MSAMGSTAFQGFKGVPLSISQLRLSIVLKCGQSFRWQKLEDPQLPDPASIEWRLALQDRVVCLRQTPEILYYRAAFRPDSGIERMETQDSTLAWLRDYFQLDVDLVEVFSRVDDPIFQRAVRRFDGGIRMLRQDPWENLVS